MPRPAPEPIAAFNPKAPAGLWPGCITGMELYVAIASCKGFRPDGCGKLDDLILTSERTTDGTGRDGAERTKRGKVDEDPRRLA